MQIVGYAYEADTWCEDCLPIDPEDFAASPIFDIDEWDDDVYCNACHALLLETPFVLTCTTCGAELARGYLQTQHYRGSHRVPPLLCTECIAENEEE